MMRRIWRRDPAPKPTPDTTSEVTTWRRSFEFVAFAEDSMLSARISVEAERLADMLNATSTLALTDVLLMSLVDGHVLEIPSFCLDRDDVYAVQGIGPRGNEERRLRTRLHSVAIGLGPYRVRGGLHTPPRVDPFHATPTADLLAVTDAEIGYHDGQGAIRTIRAAVLLVNRRKVEWVAPTIDETVVMPELAYALESVAMAKDHTGELKDL